MLKDFKKLVSKELSKLFLPVEGEEGFVFKGERKREGGREGGMIEGIEMLSEWCRMI